MKATVLIAAILGFAGIAPGRGGTPGGAGQAGGRDPTFAAEAPTELN